MRVSISNGVFIYGLLYVVKFEFGIDSKFVVVHLYKPAKIGRAHV